MSEQPKNLHEQLAEGLWEPSPTESEPMIGGHDITFRAFSHLPAKALILARMREEWPAMIVVDDPSGEFFVFRDKAAQDDWNGQPDNSMLHFILGKPHGRWREVTVVCDDPPPQPLIDDLQKMLCPIAHRTLTATGQ